MSDHHDNLAEATSGFRRLVTVILIRPFLARSIGALTLSHAGSFEAWVHAELCLLATGAHGRND